MTLRKIPPSNLPDITVDTVRKSSISILPESNNIPNPNYPISHF